VSSAILTERIRQAVTRALEQINGDLERLVDQELDRQLRTLVDERLAARNGHSLQAQPVQTAQLCKTCGERPRAKGRTVCGRCRARARAAEPAVAEGDRPAVDAPYP
jgi:hypothetical protein